LKLSFFLKPGTPFLHPSTVEGHLKQLDTGSTAVEEDLNLAYDEIFKRNTNEKSIERRHASKIYKMLICGNELFSIDTVTTAVAFNEEDNRKDKHTNPAYIRRLTQDFIIETESGTLAFAHVSVKDYLQGAHQLNYSNAKCHALVARVCLKYISSRDSATYKAEMHSNKFLGYSNRFWGMHCAQLSKEDRQSLGVSKELLDWLIEGSGSTTFRDWLHASIELEIFFNSSVLDSNNPVLIACYWNLIEVLEKFFLTDPEYDLNRNLNNNEYTPLSIAAYRGHEEVIELLLKREKVDVNLKGGNNQTPLLCAAQRGHEAIVQLLLEKGADPAAADEDGSTPLHLASGRGHAEVVKLLLEKGADPTAADKDGRTPLYWASGRGRAEVVKLLLEKGDDLAAANKYGSTPLHLASGRGRAEVVKLLLEKGADPAAADKYGSTPLHLASGRGHAEVVKLLLEKGADPIAADRYGRTPLHCASESGDVEVVKLLLEKGADPTAADGYGSTPLLCASERGDVEVVKLLLEKGADPAAADEDGQTPLYWASEGGRFEVVRLLSNIS
jgi:ankyrin repeat protein